MTTRPDLTFGGSVTQQTHCVHGHPFDVRNTYLRSNGNRDCRACIRNRVKRYKLRRKSGENAGRDPDGELLFEDADGRQMRRGTVPGRDPVDVSPAQPLNALDVQRLFWHLVQTYDGGVEVDNVARFNRHLRVEWQRLTHPSEKVDAHGRPTHFFDSVSGLASEKVESPASGFYGDPQDDPNGPEVESR